MTFETWISGFSPLCEENKWAIMIAESAWQAAFRAGQEDMRERACGGIEEAKEGFENDSQWAEGYAEALGDVLEGIRALEIKGE